MLKTSLIVTPNLQVIRTPCYKSKHQKGTFHTQSCNFLQYLSQNLLASIKNGLVLKRFRNYLKPPYQTYNSFITYKVHWRANQVISLLSVSDQSFNVFWFNSQETAGFSKTLQATSTHSFFTCGTTTQKLSYVIFRRTLLSKWYQLTWRRRCWRCGYSGSWPCLVSTSRIIILTAWCFWRRHLDVLSPLWNAVSWYKVLIFLKEDFQDSYHEKKEVKSLYIMTFYAPMWVDNINILSGNFYSRLLQQIKCVGSIASSNFVEELLGNKCLVNFSKICNI